jgi:teichuronic acid biosynthesis glycosyltransferase TuaC
MKRDHVQQQEHYLRVMMVVPGQENDLHPMVFARRQISAIEKAGITVDRFYLTSRTSPWVIIKEYLRFRNMIHKSHPDLIHAHYGTVTALFCSLSLSIPLVITFRGNDINPDPHNFFIRDRISRMFSQFAALRAKGIICVSEEIKSRIWLNNTRIRAQVIPVGVNLEIGRAHV